MTVSEMFWLTAGFFTAVLTLALLAHFSGDDDDDDPPPRAA